MTKKCAICKEVSDSLNKILIHEDDLTLLDFICFRCWDVISTIARQIAREEIQKAQDAIDQMWKEEYCNEP